MTRVRATRAYIAGVGTAGSLLAGAAVMFVLASAVVSFRGWPQVGDQASSAPAGVRAVIPPQPSVPAAARVVVFATAARTAGVAGAAGPGTSPAPALGTTPVGSRGPGTGSKPGG